jgi:pimeloyl-ACP methyl ester carboxylesterase
MPTLSRPDGTIHFEVYGSGHPVLLFAPGGLRSRMEMWSGDWPWTDWRPVLSAAGLTVVAMDQRNAGQSRAAIQPDHGWHTYAADQLALMDHLEYEQFHILGTCVGGSFCLKMLETAPERVTAAVLQNPIGVHPDEPDHFQKAHVE